ncbi:malto-oligosyltrehalose trehalohydrolase [Arenibaculum pallidiluteum]|uniref:malto-oligosyltrehalose trehalohydrolase n=1 Tax=Arenibaculum pallidiluteum TaxID=2812559 RepID=UPI001F38CA58|nr:malto-oligosyltrehalose trehalohydrolase [Arenibaculum pallidiluteum]
MAIQRRMPIGAEPFPDGVHLRVWAPDRQDVRACVVEGGRRGEPVRLERDGEGYHAGVLPDAGAGTLYGLLLDGDEKLYPDPASRFQPQGVHGPSAVVDPDAYRWNDDAWQGPPAAGNVLYEMHVGAFTKEGTWTAAMAELPALAELGVTVIEMMPAAEFAGAFGWGYDGVALFAPTRLYGEPDDLRRFVDRAHQLGIAVIHDVVYNHLGPDGNYLKEFAKAYFTDRYENEWGEPINFDGPGSSAVREYFVANARYWAEEFHIDGLRLDATQQIFDASPVHVITEIAEAMREAAGPRRTLIIGENEPQQVQVVRSARDGGIGLDAVWNDDFHHSAMVALTGRSEAYYSDHLGRAQEFVSAAKYGFLFQGQRYAWQKDLKRGRGTPTFGLPPQRFVWFLQNHDQIANSATGARVHELCHPGSLRALTALMLLSPGTPMLFMGQEFLASSPFLYFADNEPELARKVAQGRAEFLSQFSSVATPLIRKRLKDPTDPRTFEDSKLDHAEREENAHAWLLHRDLLAVRRADAAFARNEPGRVDGAVLGADAFVLRFFGPEPPEDRLLLVNLGRDLRLEPMPEPLLAPPVDLEWRLRWRSEDPRYGGIGIPPFEPAEPWILSARSALVLAPAAGKPRDPARSNPGMARTN